LALQSQTASQWPLALGIAKPSSKPVANWFLALQSQLVFQTLTSVFGFRSMNN
jgi:hypothetical protein